MTRPTEIAGLHEIATRFEHVLVDQWGTLHEGETVFPAARACLKALRAAGKQVMILSNSGRRAADNVRRLAELGLPAKEHDGVITSGEVAWHGLHQRKTAPYFRFGRRCFLITRGDPAAMTTGLNLTIGDPDNAEFVWLAGLEDNQADLAYWRDQLRRCVVRKLPMLCTNPDLTMFTTNGLKPAPGALAQLYTDLGGKVEYVGKPHGAIFSAALDELGNPSPERVLVIGDSLDHDIVGGRRAGMLTALITSGIHNKALVMSAGGNGLAAEVTKLAGAPLRTPMWAMPRLAWE